MEEKTNYFKAMRKISRAFGTTLDRDELLALVIQSAIDTMDGKGASLFLIDEESNEFVRVANQGLSEDYLRSGLTPPQKESDRAQILTTDCRAAVALRLRTGHRGVVENQAGPRHRELPA